MNKNRVIITAILVILAIYLVSSFLYPVSVYSDSAFGLFIWRSMLHGAPFNTVATPNPVDRAVDLFTFQPWWSPGQYLVPGVISLTGLTPGRAIWITVALASIVGLTGCYRLYHRLGFSQNISLISCLILVLTRGFTLPFHTYNGGEILLFGFLPWAMLLGLRVRNLSLPSIPLLVSAFLFGAFLKHSFFITAFAILAAKVLTEAFSLSWPWPSGQRRRLAGLVARAGLIFGAFYAILHFGYLARGTDPSELGGGKFSLFPSIYGISAPLLSAASFGEVLPRIFVSGSTPRFESLAELGWLYAILAILAIVTYREICRHGSAEYRTWLVAFVVIFTIALAVLSARTPEIHNEDRHFRPVALLVAPGLTALLLRQRANLLRLSLGLILLLGTGYSLVSYGAITLRNRRAPVGRSGICYHSVTREELDAIHEKDRLARPTDLIELPAYDLSLEVSRARVVISTP